MSASSVAVFTRCAPEARSTTTSGAVALRLAMLLAKSNLSPTLCVVEQPEPVDQAIRLDRLMRPLGVPVLSMHLPVDSGLRKSLATLEWLEAEAPAAAIFVDCEDVAYFPALARRTRTGLSSTALVTASHSACAMEREVAGRFLGGPEELLDQHLKAQAVGLVDLPIALNAWAERWVRQACEPGDVERPLTLPCPPLAFLSRPAPSQSNLTIGVRRLALCGAVSGAGGVRRTVELLRHLSRAWPVGLNKEVEVVGRWGSLPNGETAAALFARIAIPAGLAIRWRDPEDYVRDVQNENTISDLALFVDPTPQSFDFFAALTGARGLGAVVDDNPYAALLTGQAAALRCATSLEALAARAAAPLPDRNTREAGRKAILTETARASDRIVQEIKTVLAIAPVPAFTLANAPKVSVCISHFDRPDLLDQALRSLEAQDYPNVEVVLVDDASPSPKTKAHLVALEKQFASKGWQLLYNQTEKWQQESRNIAVRAATGIYVLIMDDDNCARRDEITTLVTVAEGLKIPIVRCLQSNFKGDDYPRQDSTETDVDFFPVGGPLSVGTMWNIFGDVNVLYKREIFLQLGGFVPTLGLGCEDFEIGIRGAMAGLASITVPRILYDYRLSSLNMAKFMDNKRLYDSHARLAEIYEAKVPVPLRPVFRLLNEQFHRVWQRDGHAYWSRLRLPADSFRRSIQSGAGAIEGEAMYMLAGMLVEEGALEDADRLISELLLLFPEEHRINALKHKLLFLIGDFAGARQFANNPNIFTEFDQRRISEINHALNS